MVQRTKKKKTNDAPDGFSDKSWNKLSVPWRDAALTKQTEELEKDLIKAVRSMSNTSFDMKNDKKLSALKDEVKELGSFYRETIDLEKAKIDFCVYLFNSRGTKVSKNTQDAVDNLEDDDEEN
jgi:hypothetical protein